MRIAVFGADLARMVCGLLLVFTRKVGMDSRLQISQENWKESALVRAGLESAHYLTHILELVWRGNLLGPALFTRIVPPRSAL